MVKRFDHIHRDNWFGQDIGIQIPAYESQGRSQDPERTRSEPGRESGMLEFRRDCLWKIWLMPHGAGLNQDVVHYEET